MNSDAQVPSLLNMGLNSVKVWRRFGEGLAEVWRRLGGGLARCERCSRWTGVRLSA